ncbi:PREDICTED: uncharacterized protein LOC104779323 [Camelina sativa]|uniref:Uncharacterized protein LOC104779323 n=1 Tax=Camelina sativa TaxID=90675 RepID=A0ABM1RC03_CAMSA|nr:PREDICTED: uncharacterized protein LOC104779323 [Camelina sativa]
MVTLRRTSKRLARGSGSAAKSATPARSKTTRPIPASYPSSPTISPSHSPIPVRNFQDPSNPVNHVTFGANPASIGVNPTSSSIPIKYFGVPNPISSQMSQEQFAFDGIQYSPYFLNSGDNPGSYIISEVLDGTNYNTWNIAITTALDIKNKLAFVDGFLARPLETHPHYRIWSRCNAMVKSWILNSVTKEIYGSILRFKDASAMWQDLLVRFHITNLPRSYQLTQQIWSLHQGALPGMAFSSSTLKFVGILRVTGNTLSSRSMIIDSGATHHVSHDKSLFVHMTDSVCGKTVTLPTGPDIWIAGIGQIRLNDSLILSNVLYIPDYASISSV